MQMVHLANAAANLGYRVVLVYPHKTRRFYRWLGGFQPIVPSSEIQAFYQLQGALQLLPVDTPWLGRRWAGKWTDANTWLCKYHWPLHLCRRATLVHSRDWNTVQAAIKSGVPAIYERDHCEQKQYDPELVNSSYLQAVVTVAKPVRENLIANGIPAHKIVQLHNGFNQAFADRHPEASQAWRSRLLNSEQTHLVAYAGALETFKGIDLLLAIAPQFPQVQFALAGGPPKRAEYYRDRLTRKQITNVSLVGYLSHDQLAPLLQAADVLVYPHCSGPAATFTSPMKLFDYMAAGRAILATKIPPLQEFQNSPLVTAWAEPDSAPAFAAQLRQVLECLPNWTPDSRYTPEQIQPFSWEARIENTLARVDESVRDALGKSK